LIYLAMRVGSDTPLCSSAEKVYKINSVILSVGTSAFLLNYNSL